MLRDRNLRLRSGGFLLHFCFPRGRSFRFHAGSASALLIQVDFISFYPQGLKGFPVAVQRWKAFPTEAQIEAASGAAAIAYLISTDDTMRNRSLSQRIHLNFSPISAPALAGVQIDRLFKSKAGASRSGTPAPPRPAAAEGSSPERACAGSCGGKKPFTDSPPRLHPGRPAAPASSR